MQPYHPNAPSRAENLIAVLRTREGDKLCQDAANVIERLREQEYRMAARIHQQRVQLRDNWQTIEMRAQYKRAWYPSPLLKSILGNRRRRPSLWRRIAAAFYF